ncbi:MAG: radical SAM protein [Candidatus Saganbacteria bacterium]|nr:radical SAM protein [Candidatus Saganbacteria bacterium]
MKYIYGPVPSWRLGRSLGVDLVSGDKTCSFDCVYCQLGKTVRHYIKRQLFVPIAEIVEELESVPRLNIDYITLSGTGEPTLALNLGDAIEKIKGHFTKPVAVLTNSSLLHDSQVRKELGAADLVVAKLDAPNEEIFHRVSRPSGGITFHMIVDGIKRFNQEYPGKLALQMMFVPQNKEHAAAMARLAKEIGPVEVQLNTPLRPSPVKPLTVEELAEVKKIFLAAGLERVYSVYDVERPETRPLDESETRRRRPEA